MGRDVALWSLWWASLGPTVIGWLVLSDRDGFMSLVRRTRAHAEELAPTLFVSPVFEQWEILAVLPDDGLLLSQTPKPRQIRSGPLNAQGQLKPSVAFPLGPQRTSPLALSETIITGTLKTAHERAKYLCGTRPRARRQGLAHWQARRFDPFDLCAALLDPVQLHLSDARETVAPSKPHDTSVTPPLHPHVRPPITLTGPLRPTGGGSGPVAWSNFGTTATCLPPEAPPSRAAPPIDTSRAPRGLLRTLLRPIDRIPSLTEARQPRRSQDRPTLQT